MIALTKIRSHVRSYKRGDVLGEEFTQDDIKRLVRLKAVEGTDYNFDAETAFFGVETTAFLTETELHKISSKVKLIEYAQSIGLEELSTEMKREEITDSILNYIEEMEATEE